jgi:hypothetical protein
LGDWDALEFPEGVMNMADKEDEVVDSITNTIDWAFKLGYSDKKSVKIARRALEKKGLVSHPAFEAAWTIALDLRGLPELADKYLHGEANV